MNKATLKTIAIVAAGVIAAGWVLAYVPSLQGRRR